MSGTSALEIPPPPARQPMQWRLGLDCLKRLMDEPDETANAMDLFMALGTKDFERNFQQLTREPRGRALLVERPDLLAKLCDREGLAALSEGSLGRAWLEYFERYRFDPARLIALQHQVADRWEAEEGAACPDEMRRWYRDRSLLLHDLFHVLTGYGADQIGEATLLAFTQGQLGGRVNRLLTIGASFEVMQAMGTRWLPYVFRAWRRGRRAVALDALCFEELLPRPLDEVRRLTRIEAPDVAHPDGLLQGRVSDIRAQLAA